MKEQTCAALAACDRCGRTLPLAELHWLHGELLCDPCRQEDDCGCGDHPAD